jgi:hypothetical protein
MRRSPLLDLVRLTSSRRRGAGSPAVAMGLVSTKDDAAVLAGVLGDDSLSICPLCPVLPHVCADGGSTPGDLAALIDDLLDGPARVIAVGTTILDSAGERSLIETLDRAAERGVLVTAAAQATPTAVTRHPWVLPVFSCAASGRASWFVDIDDDPRGLLAPGENVPHPGGLASGNSVAAAVVAGTAALLLSLFPQATGHQVRSALSIGAIHPRRIGPPLLDAERAFEFLSRPMIGRTGQD